MLLLLLGESIPFCVSAGQGRTSAVDSRCAGGREFRGDATLLTGESKQPPLTMKRWVTIPFFLLLGLLIGPTVAHGQGATTASIRGQVVDAEGEPLPGANVVAVHVPSGTRYGTSTNQRGRYTLSNMRVGGPYRITASFVGYQSKREESISLNLGETTRLNFQLQEQTAELEEVEVVARRGGILSSEREGVATNISGEELESQPTMGRRLADVARLTPQAYVANSDDDGPAISIAGQNTDFNSISIDGAVSNDVFGLSAQGIDGGQSGASVISLSAIEQISVDVSPFTVTRSGFTGGAINMVTKSGTNQFEGAVEYYRRGSSLTQNELTVGGDKLLDGLPSSPSNRVVFSLGGPIVEDKLFFFVNADINRDDEGKPLLTPYDGGLNLQGEGANDELDSVFEIRDFMQQNTGYDPGTPGDKTKILEADKFLGRLDYNISQNHKLTARYFYNDHYNVDRFQSLRDLINFSNNSEVFPHKQHNAMLQWNGSFGTSVSTQTTATLKNVEDDRGVQGEPFPTINIDDGDGEIRLGSDPFSRPNFLEQTVGTFTNQTDIFLGDHTVTVGTHNEFYKVDNRFAIFGPGLYTFNSVDDFVETVCHYAQQPNRPGEPGPICQSKFPDGGATPQTNFYIRQYSLLDDNPNTPEFESHANDNTNLRSEFSAVKLGFYAQDKWQVTDRLRVTFGLRADLPKILDDPQTPPATNWNTILAIQNAGYDLNGARAGEMPDWRAFWSPRGGFNFALNEERTSQIRGGAGVYTSRFPFVAAGGAYLNDGVSGDVAVGLGFAGPLPLRRPENGLTKFDEGVGIFGGGAFGGTPASSVSELIPTGNLHLFRNDFSYPRVLRTTLAYDRSLPFGLVGTLEGQYSNQLQDVIVRNVNLKQANGQLDADEGTGDDRPIWQYGGRDQPSIGVDSRYGDIFLYDNTTEGYSYNLTVRLQKQPTEVWERGSVRGNISYSYGDARSLNTYGGDTAGSLWDENAHVKGTNNLTLGRSSFSQGHRVQLSMAYRQEITQNVSTNLSIYYSGTSGRPFSYTIDSDRAIFPGDDGGAPLLYVPSDVSNLRLEPITDRDGNVTRTVQEQQEDLRRFINNVDHLSENRGGYVDRNGDRTPFEGVVDLKFSLDFSGELVGRNQRLSLMADVFNFSSLLGSIFGTDWGRRYLQAGEVDVLRFRGYEDSDGDGNPTPVYQSDLGDTAESVDRSKDDLFQVESGTQTYSSLYQVQLGVKYTF